MHLYISRKEVIFNNVRFLMPNGQTPKANKIINKGEKFEAVPFNINNHICSLFIPKTGEVIFNVSSEDFDIMYNFSEIKV